MKILSFLCAAALALSATAATAKERTVVVVLFDGFSPASLDATRTPNFDRIKKDGAWSRHLVPAFPTISLINHTTFETGCWPSHHGIVSNFFYDPKKGLFPQSDDAAWRTG
jgi:predicted AlkP superfamily pyrophosphatase or phosphodiesterase